MADFVKFRDLYSYTVVYGNPYCKPLHLQSQPCDVGFKLFVPVYLPVATQERDQQTNKWPSWRTQPTVVGVTS